MFPMHRFLVILASLNLAQGRGLISKNSVYFQLERVQSCNLGPYKDVSEVSLNKCNRTHNCLTLKVNLREEIGQESSIELKIGKWNSAGWAPNVLQLKFDNPCTNVDKIIGKIWSDIKQRMDIQGCPIKRGNYTLLNYIAPRNFTAPFPMFLVVGKYMLRFLARTRGTVIFCKDFIASLKDTQS